MPDNIIDLWEKYNVTNGADIILVSICMVFSLSLSLMIETLRFFLSVFSLILFFLPNDTKIEIYFSC